MLERNTNKIVFSGFMLALGILLPYFTSHGLFMIPGKILLPMHIPVLLCGFLCGPLYGALCGLMLPYLNSVLTGMPAMYPNAIVMGFELMTYGFVCGLTHKAFGYSKKLKYIYPSLAVALICGRVVYGGVAGILLFSNSNLQGISVVASVVDGIPGIAIQLVLVPQIIRLVPVSNTKHLRKKTTKIIKQGKATCVVIRQGEIIYAKSHKGIGHLIELKEKGYLKNSYVADTVVGKAAAMIMTLGQVHACHGENVSNSAVEWFENCSIPFTYTNKSPYIVNRKGDGMCPMENTVKDIQDPQKGFELLKEKLEEMKKENSK